MFIYLILWTIVQYCFMYFVVQIVPALAIGISFSWLLCHFEKLPSLYACVSVVFKKCSFYIYLIFKTSVIVSPSVSYPQLQNNGERLVASINGVGKQDIYMKENETEPCIYTIYIHWNWALYIHCISHTIYKHQLKMD